MQGSIKKYVGKRGVTWRAVVDIGTHPMTGKRIQRRVSAKTRRQCEEAVATLIVDAKNRLVAHDGTMSVAAFAARWLEGKRGHVRPSTLRRYDDLLRLHVLPSIGTLKLRDLGPLQIQRLHSSWSTGGLSPTSAYHAHYIVHGLFEQAVQWRLLVTNPCKLVKPPRRGKAEIKTWSTDEVARVLEAAHGTDIEALCTLAISTGMRRGEILGLKWDDIDLERRELSVRRTLSRGGGNHAELGSPKTAASRRSIALPSIAVKSLERHRREQETKRQSAASAWHRDGFVFTDDIGRPMHPNTLRRRFDVLIHTADVPRIRIHDLRHTNATLLLAKDVHPKVVQERLGHSAIGMTLDLYSHTVPHMQREAADLLDEELADSSAADEEGA
jgi:integrase